MIKTRGMGKPWKLVFARFLQALWNIPATAATGNDICEIYTDFTLGGPTATLHECGRICDQKQLASPVPEGTMAQCSQPGLEQRFFCCKWLHWRSIKIPTSRAMYGKCSSMPWHCHPMKTSNRAGLQPSICVCRGSPARWTGLVWRWAFGPEKLPSSTCEKSSQTARHHSRMA